MSRIRRLVTDVTRRDEIELDAWAIIKAAFAVHTLALIAILLPESVPDVLSVPPIVVDAILVPGSLLLVALRGQIDVDARWVAYAFGTSLLLLLVHGVAINLFLPLVGVPRPMTTLPLAVGLSVLVLGLSALVLRRQPDAVVSVGVPENSPVPFALLLLPLWSILAVWILNGVENNLPIIFVLGILSVVPLAMVVLVDDPWHTLGVWTVSLAVIYHKALSRLYGFSGSPDVVFNYEFGRWTPGINADTSLASELLPNAVLYPTLAHLTDLPILTQMEVVNPLIVSSIPVVLYLVSRRFVDSRLALLAGAVFAFAHPFYLQYPAGGRAATPVVFLALFALALTDHNLPTYLQRGLKLGFAAGVVVSHYGTSYIILFTLVGASGLLFAYAVIDGVIEQWRRFRGSGTPLLQTDGGPSLSERVASSTWRKGRLTLSLVGFYATVNLAWYLYTDGGDKFGLLPRHIERTVTTILVGNTFTGQTANRLQRDYGTLSIELSKKVYYLIGLLMIIGLASVYYRRFVDRTDCSFDDEHLAIATVLLGIFGMTILVPSWGGGRPMMITFTFTTLYAVVGATTVGTVVVAGLRRLSGSVPDSLPSGPTIGARTFGTLLVVLFLLNSGVVAAVVTSERAPSNVPSQPEIVSGGLYGTTDSETHAWLIDNTAQSGRVYGDSVAHYQADWLNPQIATRTATNRRYGGNRPGRIDELLESGVPQGYVILRGGNLANGQFSTDPPTPLSEIRPEREAGSLIYVTGDSEVYYLPPNAENHTVVNE